jgi:hypothetical protein
MAIMRSIARRAEAHPSRRRAIAPILQRRHPSAAATGLTAHPSTNGSGGGVGGSRNIVQPSVPPDGTRQSERALRHVDPVAQVLQSRGWRPL